MPQLSPSIHLLITIPLGDYAVYAEAVRLLKRIMGRKAPDAISLIIHTLRCRDARGLADDYLESVDWPVAAGRKNVPGASSGARPSATRRSSAILKHTPLDPSRN